MQNNPLVVIAILLAVVVYFILRQQTSETLTPLAEKFNGEYARNDLANMESFTIPYHECTLIVKLHVLPDTQSVIRAALQTDSPHLPELTLSTNSILKKAFNYEGENRILTGDERFDTLFQVASDDAGLVRKIFSEDVREGLKNKILHMPTFEMSPNTFAMKAFLLNFSPSPERSATVLEHFTKTAISILDRAWQ